MARSKKCFKCGIEKKISEFYKHPEMGDGHLGKCKDCTRADVAEHRIKNIDKIREYDRKRSKLPRRAALRILITSRWRQEDRRRAKCHNATKRAVMLGKLVRLPCEVCGSETSHAHHDDYDAPLTVRWLCPIHHLAHHAKMKRIK